MVQRYTGITGEHPFGGYVLYTGHAALESILRRIINDLPTKRDWLDPELEKAARDILEGVK